MALLELRDLQAGYGPVSVLRNINIAIEADEVVGILGANGAGKSTLMRAIVGLIPLQKGEIVFDGRVLTRASAPQRVGQGIALVPEGRMLFPPMTVLDHLLLGSHPDRPTRAERDARLRWVFDLFPMLRERLDATASVLSGGQQQMLAIARALMSRPRLLLLDEPSMGIAPLVRRDIYATLARLIGAEGLTVVVVEQDASLALRLVKRVLLMQGGGIVSDRNADAFRDGESLQRAYLGSAP
ncbi:MAG: ABC transporter ATP-binding protein [Rhodospirillales bacterium]|nr:ABC transporter ATP-binding protein [Rhodospirillales bacterium]